MSWRAIEGYVGLYAVSEAGQVLSMNYAGSGAPGLLKPQVRRGYESVYLYTAEHEGKWHTVHSLVLAAFIGPRPKGMHVNHKDGVKTNNALYNLEYCTPSQNMKHAHATGLQSNRGENHSRSKLTNETVAAILVRLANGERPAVIARDVGVDATNIYHIRSGRIWAHLTDRKAG